MDMNHAVQKVTSHTKRHYSCDLFLQPTPLQQVMDLARALV
jgi:hypothetical protein